MTSGKAEVREFCKTCFTLTTTKRGGGGYADLNKAFKHKPNRQGCEKNFPLGSVPRKPRSSAAPALAVEDREPLPAHLAALEAGHSSAAVT